MLLLLLLLLHAMVGACYNSRFIHSWDRTTLRCEEEKGGERLRSRPQGRNLHAALILS